MYYHKTGQPSCLDKDVGAVNEHVAGGAGVGHDDHGAAGQGHAYQWAMLGGQQLQSAQGVGQEGGGDVQRGARGRAGRIGGGGGRGRRWGRGWLSCDGFGGG